MPLYHRIYSPGELQFLTASTYRRAQVFRSLHFCHYFVQRHTWPWSSWRFYYWEDASILRMDRLG